MPAKKSLRHKGYAQAPRLSSSRSVTASQAKRQFGQILDTAMAGTPVTITKHRIPKAVLMSMDQFMARSADARIESLTTAFDAQLARMQSLGSRKAMQAAFDASPSALGRFALTAARKRG